ncbi:MAG: radical SAM protein [Geobacter sp.]|nr:radical SAM protein [Geobacter sp.]
MVFSKKFLQYKLRQNFFAKLFYMAFPDRYVNHYRQIKTMYLELSSRCNLKCTFCFQQYKPENTCNMPVNCALAYLGKLPASVTNLILHFSGESFLNPDLPVILKSIAGKNIHTHLCSNGTLPGTQYIDALNAGLNHLIFALDGTSQESHGRHRIGSDFSKILNTLKEVVGNKPPGVSVGVQCVVTKYNENEIEEMKTILRGVNADFLYLKTLSLDIASSEKLNKLRYENALSYLPVNNEYSRYKRNRKNLKLKMPIIVCPYVYEPVVCADGEVALCCIDIERKVKIGNIKDYNSFAELWNTKHYREIRKQVLHKKLALCQRCNMTMMGISCPSL